MEELDTVLWILQTILCIKLLTVSYTHGLGQGKTEMRQAIEKMGDASRPSLFVIASSAGAGSVGLILPDALGYQPWITTWTTVVLGVMLLFSIVFHVRYRDQPKVFVSLILFAISTIVVFVRMNYAQLF